MNGLKLDEIQLASVLYNSYIYKVKLSNSLVNKVFKETFIFPWKYFAPELRN